MTLTSSRRSPSASAASAASRGAPELAARRARKALGRMRLGRGEWRKLKGTAPAGPSADVDVLADQNRKQVARELPL